MFWGSLGTRLVLLHICVQGAGEPGNEASPITYLCSGGAWERGWSYYIFVFKGPGSLGMRLVLLHIRVLGEPGNEAGPITYSCSGGAWERGWSYYIFVFWGSLGMRLVLLAYRQPDLVLNALGEGCLNLLEMISIL